MGEAAPAEKANLICAALAGSAEWFEAAGERLEKEFGPIDIESETWPFEFTSYYEAEMGPGLLRRIYSFKDLIDPGTIVAIKHATNRIEKELSAQLQQAPPRPVNLDPGYVSAGKLVLATTKDHAHRLYLGEGIYAECTLRWHKGAFEPWPWTYPDYRTEHYREFFSRVRSLRSKKLTEPSDAQR